MPFIKFTQPAKLLDGSDNDCRVLESYKVGQVVEMSSANARRWVRRNFAEAIKGESAESAAVHPTSDPAEASSPAPEPKKRGRPRKVKAKPIAETMALKAKAAQSSSAEAAQASDKNSSTTSEGKPS